MSEVLDHDPETEAMIRKAIEILNSNQKVKL